MLVVTLGDPHGVTVELLAAALPLTEAARHTPVVLVGSLWQWRDQLHRLGHTDFPLAKVWSADAIDAVVRLRDPGLYFFDVGSPADAAPAESLSAAARGGLMVRSLDWLRELAHARQRLHIETALAVVTGPIDKHAAVSAGFSFPGQTEFFADLWRSPAIMILAGPQLRVGLATNHLALRDVPSALTQERLVGKILLLCQAIRETYGIAKPRIAVCGLNPHASDQGLFGDEEARIIAPAVAAARSRLGDHATIAGPLPADTAFYFAYKGEFDVVLAMYHDQGLGPLKTVHFDNAVNISGGLPHFRASPDHGPATDLFLRGRASPASLVQAVNLALSYLRHKESLER